jgi:uncharacterized protein YndB with AHSA1/START domain
MRKKELTDTGMNVRTIIEIDDDARNVWKALTDPRKTERYMFGWEIASSFAPGTPVAWHEGTPDGQLIHMRGMVLVNRKHEFLRYTTWSPDWGLPDGLANHTTVTCEVTRHHGRTRLTITHGDFSIYPEGKAIATMMSRRWAEALTHMKWLLEDEATYVYGPSMAQPGELPLRLTAPTGHPFIERSQPIRSTWHGGPAALAG